MSVVESNNGFLLLDAGLNPIASNDAALQIFSFPSGVDRIKQTNIVLAEQVYTTLLDQKQDRRVFVNEFKSGKRRYICRSFRLDRHENYPVKLGFVVLLERNAAASTGLTEISKQFDLTQRERETVEFLVQGLTSKEIANRMKISPNTVKAFLRLVMVKMDVSTRSGIAGKIVGSRSHRVGFAHCVGAPHS
jgi:DNA-binding CsgD family transcriptional regulator